MNMSPRRTTLVAGLAAIQLVVAFVGNWMVLFVLGVGRDTDALYAAIALPQVLALIFSNPLAAILLPKLGGLDEDERRSLASAVMLTAMLVTVPTMALLAWTAPAWTQVILPGFVGEDNALVVRLARIHLIGAAAQTGQNIAWASLLARGRIVGGELGQVVAATLMTATIYPVATEYGVEGVAWLFTGRHVMRLALTLPLSSVRPRLRLRGTGAQTLVKRSIPLWISQAYRNSEGVLDSFVLSLAPAGAISLYNLALTMHNAVLNIVHKSAVIPHAPHFGLLAKEGRIDALLKSMGRVRRGLALFATTGLIFLVLFGYPSLRLLVGHGGVTDENVRDLWQIAVALTGIHWGVGAASVVAMSFHALEMTRTAAVLAAVCFSIGMVFKLAGFFWFGVLGFAVGTSTYHLFYSLFMGIMFSRLVAEQRRDAGGHPHVATQDAAS